MPERRVSLWLVAVIAALCVASVLVLFEAYGQVTSTVEVSVADYISANAIDSSSTVTIDPANAPTLSYNSWNMWAGAAPNDDIIIDLTGTNVNVTAYVSRVTYTLPPSWPNGLPYPLLWLNYTLDSSSASESLSSAAIMVLNEGQVALNADNDLLANQYVGTNSLTWIDLPEGFLNLLYDKSLDETSWYYYTYAKKVTLPVLVLKYNPGNAFTLQRSDITVCILVADKNGSIHNSHSADGDEAVLIKVGDCNFDADGSDSTTGASDLASTADYAFPGLVTTSGEQKLYAANQLAFRLLNATVTLTDGSTATLYAKVKIDVDSNTNDIVITLYPAYPIPYSNLGSIYANNQEPYLHAWPAVLVPVGAPAGNYKITADIAVEQP